MEPALPLAIAGAMLSLLLLPYAARRSAAQPLPRDERAETSALQLARAGCAAPHDPALADLIVDPALEAEYRTLALTACSCDTTAAPDELADARAALEAAAFDREAYQGALPITRVDVPPYLQRAPARDGVFRRILVLLAFAATGALAGTVAQDALAAVAIVALGSAGWVVALVDHDTLYLDIRTWWIGTILAAGFTLASSPGTFGWGILAGAVWWGSFELLNLLYRRLRGVDGIGGGDGQIAFGAALVAVGLTGSLPLALWSVMAGMCVSLVVSLPLLLLRRRGAREAFALGPFLAAGWQIALLAHHAGWLV